MRPVEKISVICWNCQSPFLVYPSRKNPKSCSFECRSMTPLRRFVVVGWTIKPNGCWEWDGSRTPKGYGYVCSFDKNFVASRLSWEHHFGPIPEGLFALHKCDNPPCVNPSHLFLGTKADNNADMLAKGRYRGLKGVLSPNVTITEEVAAEIKSRPRIRGSGVAIAKEFGVSPMLVSAIRLGRIWSHV